MKKLLAILFVVLMTVSCLFLTACGKETYKPENAFEDLEAFDSYVDPYSAIIGNWYEVLPEDSDKETIEWDFFDTTTLHIIETADGISYSTVSAFNYNEETGELSYYMLQDKNIYKAQVEITSEGMTFKDENGEVFKTFVKAY